MSAAPDAQPVDPAEGCGRQFVVMSEVTVPPGGAEDLESAFANRLGEVDAWPGFLDLQVWKNQRAEGSYMMVSWWINESAFATYMRSTAHRRSHLRIPVGPNRPRGAGLTRFEVLSR